MNIKDNKCSPLLKFKLTSYGIFSFCIENTLFNIEVKDSITGIIDIFIVETNFDNAKFIIENLSTNNYYVYQEGYERYSNFISKNDKQILKICDQNCNYFIVKNRETKKNINLVLFLLEKKNIKKK
jgi:uncharacterized protein YutD